MSKDTFYFSHDYNARNDIKIKRLISKHGFNGYGIYWAIIEDLYNNANALPTDYECIAYDLRTDISIIESVIKDFDLFSFEDGFFGSASVERRLNERNAKSRKARESALYRWSKCERNANALPTQSDSNAIKERKGKERKSINTTHTLFRQIENLPSALKTFEGNKGYFFLAYKFWKLWESANPKHQTIQNAKVEKWYDEIRKMVEVDKTPIDRILAIYAYFSKYEDAGFRRFWFDTIKSPGGLRGKNKNGEFIIDRIIDEVNDMIDKNDSFSNYTNEVIKKYKSNASLTTP